MIVIPPVKSTQHSSQHSNINSTAAAQRQNSKAQQSTEQHSTTQHNTAKYGTAWYGAVRHGRVPLRGRYGGVELGDEPQEQLAVESLAQCCGLVVGLFHRLEHRRVRAVHLDMWD